MRWSSGCSGSLLARRFLPRWVSLLSNHAPRTPSARRELDVLCENRRLDLPPRVYEQTTHLGLPYHARPDLEQLLGRVVSTVSSSHTEREAGAHLRLLCLRAVGLRLCAPQTDRAEHAAWTSSDGLRAALLLTPPASTVRDAVERSACSSCLGQPLCWQRLPPPCALHAPVSPIADLRQPSSWHRLPPPCAMQAPVMRTL